MTVKTRPLVLLSTCALFVGACGSSEVTTADTDAGGGDDTEFVYESPLGEFLGWSDANFDEDAANAQYAEQERQVQEAIAACMREQGFEYLPIDTAAQQAFWEEQSSGDIEWGTDEWTEKYGFGITTQRFSQAQVGPDLAGSNWDVTTDQEGPPDPNQEYVESLSEVERNAYYEALYGGSDDYVVPIWEEEGREPTEEELQAYDEEFQANYTPTGCEPIAYETIYNAGNQADWETFDAEFGDALQEMEQRMESHPDVIAYRDELRTCVEATGAEYITEQEAYEYFEEQLNAAGLGWEDQPDPFEGLDTSEFTDEDFERIWQESANQLLPADQLAELAELQATEIATAVAIRDCGGGWEAEMQALADVRIEIEKEFLAENADRLAEFEGVFGN